MNKKPIMFLDIDGVLATDNEFFRVRKKFWKKYDIANKLKIPYPFNSKCVKIFNEISESVDFDIVISSDWKNHYTLDELKEIFKFNNIKQIPINVAKSSPFYQTDILEKGRLSDIGNYLTKYEITNYVIIDDLNLDYILNDDEIKKHFIKTIPNEGLKQTGLKEKIINKLKKFY